MPSDDTVSAGARVGLFSLPATWRGTEKVFPESSERANESDPSYSVHAVKSSPRRAALISNHATQPRKDSELLDTLTGSSKDGSPAASKLWKKTSCLAPFLFLLHETPHDLKNQPAPRGSAPFQRLPSGKRSLKASPKEIARPLLSASRTFGLKKLMWLSSRRLVLGNHLQLVTLDRNFYWHRFVELDSVTMLEADVHASSQALRARRPKQELIK